MRLIYAARVKPTKMDGTNDSEVEARGGEKTAEIKSGKQGRFRDAPRAIVDGDQVWKEIVPDERKREKMENAVARRNGVAKILAEEEGRA